MHVKSPHAPYVVEAEIPAAFRIEDEACIGWHAFICAAIMNDAAGET
jgi:hypothetical protein